MADAGALLQSYDVVLSPALKTLIAQASMPARGPSAQVASVVVEPSQTYVVRG
jgi:hypothetical protein